MPAAHPSPPNRVHSFTDEAAQTIVGGRTFCFRGQKARWPGGFRGRDTDLPCLSRPRPGDVDGILKRLKDYGYLDDARYAESFASARLENDGFGQSRVLRDLRQHRVAPDLAARTVSKVYADKDEPALIEQFVRRKYRTAGKDGLFESDKELAAAFRRLLRAGFSPGNSIHVLKRFAANPDLLDALENLPEEPEGLD